MNLKDNLRKLRKDNNLSQEELAEKLGVSRQSVSKWESGLAYPEMDKVIQLCNMFNLNIDDLLNQDIKKVEKTKQSKMDLGKYIDEFLGFFNKTINMFSSMSFKEKFKCLFEQVIIFFIFLIIFFIIGGILGGLFNNLNMIMPDNVYWTICDILKSLYSTASIILGLILMIQVFKTRYLNYYTIIEKEDNKEEILNNEDKEVKIISNDKQEKIIIRDPKHSEYKFIKSLLKVILFCIKLFVGFIGLFFCASFVFFVVCLVLSFMVSKTGLLFIGLFLSILAVLTLNFVILNIIYNFIVNRKIGKLFIGILLLASLIIGGVGIGLTIITAKDFEYDTIPSDKYLSSSELTFDMKKDLVIFDNYLDINYIETKSDNIKIEATYVKGLDIEFENDEDGNVMINRKDNINKYRSLIKSINNKEIIDLHYRIVNVYASKKNIEKLKENKNKYYRMYEYE